MNLRVLLVVLVIICALQLVDVSAARKAATQCKHKKYGVFKIGERKPYPNKTCAEIICKSTGKLSSLQCSRHLKGKNGCKIVAGDRKKPFPNCCPQISCPVKDTNKG
ncbi:hypothetical protein TcasGA2_TC034390 [Tribolium castaneum]|uniref:Single domain-containing protein n=1 Tax=Tribolium castaneum TaxID=7070 RepID=A0A139WBH4_TRICA|nr:PREDICTED: la1-like protein 13 [Tribolium castaneum]KYB25272.1 hypothetical protein TcasGA2_TC034390 [Tribolium castaneum]|eukprot:XP_008198015.1 PREDICTED: la1-like protein 13 [Tribolium castaneum]